MTSRITASFIDEPDLQRQGWDGKLSLDDVAPTAYLDGLSHKTGTLDGEPKLAIYDPDPQSGGAVITADEDAVVEFEEVWG